MKSIPTQFLVRCLQYALVGAALITISAIELQQASPRTAKVWILGLAFFAGVAAVMDGLARAWSEFMGPGSKQIDVEEPVKGLFLGMLGETHLELTEVGLTVFAVMRSRQVGFRRIQCRIYRFRIESNPRPTHILWTRNKGVLGQCWHARSPQGLDHAVHYKKAAACHNRREWRKLPKDVRMGLKWTDYEQVRDFEYVEAHPLIDPKGHYRGCLVVQVAKKHKARLGQERVRKLTERTCATIATVLAQ